MSELEGREGRAYGRRSLAEAIIAGGSKAAGPATPRMLPGPASAALLVGATALVQSRFTGRRRVCLRIVDHTASGDIAVLVDDHRSAAEWLAAIGLLLDGLAEQTAVAHAPPDLVVRLDDSVERNGLLAAIGRVDDVLCMDVDAMRVDGLAAEALGAALQHAWLQLQAAGGVPLQTLSILNAEQRANLLCRFQNARMRRPRGETVGSRLHSIVAAHPSQPAIVDGEHSIDYRQLWHLSGVIAAALVLRGVQPGDVVAVAGPRSADAVLAMTAILRVGAAWLPLDGQSDDAMRTLLADSAACCVLQAGAALPADIGFDAIALSMLQANGDASEFDEPPLLDAQQCAYLLPVAAADGRTTAVAVTQRSLLHGVCDIDYAATGPGSRQLCVAPLASSRSVFEIWGALLNGGTCVLHDESEPSVPGLSRVLREHDVQLALLPAELLQRSVDEDLHALSPLVQLLVSGEPSLAHLRRLQSALPDLQIGSIYGPVECCASAAAFMLPQPLPAEWQRLPIGLPVAGAAIHVLAADGGLLPIGVVGEIHLGGCGIALGYQRAAARSRQVFITDPFGGVGDRLYRTGELGRRLPDGSIERLGRLAPADGDRPVDLRVAQRAGRGSDRRVAVATRGSAAAAVASIARSASRRARHCRTAAPDADIAAGVAVDGSAVAHFIKRYTARTAGSRDCARRHRGRLADARAGGGSAPRFGELAYPLVIARSHGALIWDIDGNEYVDALNGFGSNLFGWQPDFVVDAIRRQLDQGFALGMQHPLAGAVAERICALTGFERVALCGSGSDAVLGALRIARRLTGRRRIVIFSGSRHGVFDLPVAPGGDERFRRLRPLADAFAEELQVFEYGSEQALDAIRSDGSDIAAVLVEPVRSRYPEQHSRRFLAGLVDAARAVGALSIFDEVVTGFRCAPGGARQYFAIEPDLATYGKALGGGLPIGAIAGRRGCIDVLDGTSAHGRDDAADEAVGGSLGTFVGHPLALAAANAVLQRLQETGPGLQTELNACTAEFVREANWICRRLSAPISISGFASWWTLRFRHHDPLHELLYPMLRQHGVHLTEGAPAFMTTAHGVRERRRMLDALGDSIVELQRDGLLEQARPPSRHADEGVGELLDDVCVPIGSAELPRVAQ